MAKKKKPLTDEEIIIISKSEQKRESKEMQELANTLAELSVTQRISLSLDEEMMAALRLSDKIRGKHDAYARNVRFIARLVATIDIEELKFGLERIKNRHSLAILKSQQYEALRDDVIQVGNDKIEELLALHSGLERQRMRQLVRQATKEVKEEKLGKSFKELLAYLKANVEIQS